MQFQLRSESLISLSAHSILDHFIVNQQFRDILISSLLQLM